MADTARFGSLSNHACRFLEMDMSLPISAWKMVAQEDAIRIFHRQAANQARVSRRYAAGGGVDSKLPR